MKQMKKTSILILAVFILACMFTGCGRKAKDANPAETGTQQVRQENPEERQTEQSEQETEASAFPMTVEDANGARMTLEKKPEKIVSLTLGTDEMLLGLVDKIRIKAVSYLSLDPGLSNVTEEVKDIPEKLGTEAEKIISLQPDIVFVADWTDEKFVKQLRDAQITVYGYKTPNGIEEQKKTVMEIARLVGEEQKGREMVKWMDDKLNEVEEKIKTLTEDEKLKAISLDSFFATYGTNTTFNDIVNRAGMINLAAEAGINQWQQITKEKVVEMNPDIIFLPSWSYEGFDAVKFADDFKKDKSFAGINAVKNNRVFTLPESHTTAISQNIVLGVEDAAKAAYPELFK
jgi:iron complex transport system substrate-binding protein